MNDPQTFVVKDHRLKCQHCGDDRFHHRRILLNTRAMTFFKLDWLNADADVYTCAQCGHLHWFAASLPPTTESAPEPITCLACNATIPTGATVCPKCGWSYTQA